MFREEPWCGVFACRGKNTHLLYCSCLTMCILFSITFQGYNIIKPIHASSECQIKTKIQTIFNGVGFEPPRCWIMQALGWCRIMRMTFLRKFCKSQKNSSSTAAYCSCMFVCYPNNFQGDSPWTIEFLNSATVGMLRCTSKNNTTPLTATVEFYLAPLPHGAQVFKKTLSLAPVIF